MSEVYVALIKESGKRMRISIGGGTTPLWSRDGRELFYLSGDGRSVMMVPVEPGPTFKAGDPVRLFSTRAKAVRDHLQRTSFDVAADGQRFLIGVTVEPASSRIMVVLNWSAVLQ